MNKTLFQEIEQYIINKQVFNECIYSREIINIDEILAKEQESFSHYLFSLIDQKGLKDTDIYKKANIDRKLFSKLRKKEYHPHKDTIIKLIMAMELNKEEADKLLATTGYTLSPSITRDLIITFFLEKQIYDLLLINECLIKYEQIELK